MVSVFRPCCIDQSLERLVVGVSIAYSRFKKETPTMPEASGRSYKHTRISDLHDPVPSIETRVKLPFENQVIQALDPGGLAHIVPQVYEL